MRMFKRAAGIAMMAGLVIGPGGGITTTTAASASTRPAQVWLTGGDTSATTAPDRRGAALGMASCRS